MADDYGLTILVLIDSHLIVTLIGVFIGFLHGKESKKDAKA